MARILCVHGIAQEFKSRETLLQEWAPAVCGGVSNAGGALDPADIDMAFYGILFRPKGGKGAKVGPKDVPNRAAGDVQNPLDIELIKELSAGAGYTPDMKSKAGSRTLAAMLQAIGRTPYFGDQAQKWAIWYLEQVRRYVTEPEVNAAARKSLTDRITNETRVIVGHSLGSIVAYEVLCAADPPVSPHTLITLGSPLGIPALADRINPRITSAPATWPPGIRRWFNIADDRDIVALRKDLAPIFGSRVVDHLVHNGATMHSISPYLTSPDFGQAVIAGLASADGQ